MDRTNFNQIASVLSLVALAGCASPPSRINDICSVFDERDGWLQNWQRDAKRAERKYGVPVPVLMATIRKESGFQHNARPPRTKLFGVIPWKRQSSAYGYSQALDGTWDSYKNQTGNVGARRTSFADAVDFVGWYHSQTVQKYSLQPTDTYNLYLAYYLGWGGYEAGKWRGNSGLQQYARDTDQMSKKYAAQLQACR